MLTFSLRNRQILQLALPSIISNITVPLLGLIDVAITGHLGSAAYIGAIAVGGMLFNIIYWLFAFLRMGTSGLTAQARGRRDFSEVMNLLLRSVVIAAAISMVMLFLQLPIRWLALSLIAPEAEVMRYTEQYFSICIWGAPASLLQFVLTGWLVGMQNTRIPMAMAILQNLLNIAFSTLFVYGLGWRIEGVALGTVLAQWAGMWTAVFLLYRHYYRRLIPYRQGPLFERQDLRRFFLVNRDIFFRTLCLVIVHFVFITAGAHQGTTELAVNTLLMQLFTLYSYIMDGFAFAGEALAGKAIGARTPSIYYDTVRRLFGWGTGMIALFTGAYALFGQQFLQLLTDQQQVMQAAVTYQPWTLLFPLCGMAAFIWDGVYIGATATRYMLLSMATGMGVFLCLYLVLVPVWGNHGLWLAFVAYLSTRSLMQTFTRHRIVHWDETAR